ncbi:putative carboxypeptidase D [Helianthus annuus]|nr:putative carboxypeptidase D [Helianthus annuus]
MGFQFLGTILVLCLCFSRWCNGELIKALPGQPSNYSFNQYSGYIVTNKEHGRSLFYYFVEAASPNHSSLPLTLWLNGGPGCSSLGFGAFMETGPFQIGEDGLLVLNQHSWNLESNMLYVESPIGVGFSYSETYEDYIDWNDTKTGHYIPQLADLILEYNIFPNVTKINLKAIAIGNPLLDIDISVLAGEFLWSHGAISDKTLMLEKTVCNDSKYLREYVHSGWSQGCNDVFNRVENEVSDDVQHDDLLLPKCLLPTSSSQQFKPRGLHSKAHSSVRKNMPLIAIIVHNFFPFLKRTDLAN